MVNRKRLTFTKIIDNVSDWTGNTLSFLLIPLTLVVVFEVIARSLGHPTIWSFELSNFLFGTHFMLLAAYGLLHGSHVKVDIISVRFSTKVQTIFFLIGYFTMFFPFVTVILISGIEYAALSWSIKESSWSAWGPPLYPVKIVIPLTAFLLLLQGISEVTKLINSMMNNERGQ